MIPSIPCCVIGGLHFTLGDYVVALGSERFSPKKIILINNRDAKIAVTERDCPMTVTEYDFSVFDKEGFVKFGSKKETDPFRVLVY